MIRWLIVSEGRRDYALLFSRRLAVRYCFCCFPGSFDTPLRHPLPRDSGRGWGFRQCCAFPTISTCRPSVMRSAPRSASSGHPSSVPHPRASLSPCARPHHATPHYTTPHRPQTALRLFLASLFLRTRNNTWCCRLTRLPIVNPSPISYCSKQHTSLFLQQLAICWKRSSTPSIDTPVPPMDRDVPKLG